MKPTTEREHGFAQVNSIQFDNDLTTDFLEHLLAPYMSAIADLQQVIDDMSGKQSHPATIASINFLPGDLVVGGIYTGKVVHVESFGAFVEILPSTDGMVHLSQLASGRVDKVEDVARTGDELTVMVTDITVMATDIDEQGKIRLSRQSVLEGGSKTPKAKKPKSTKRK